MKSKKTIIMLALLLVIPLVLAGLAVAVSALTNVIDIKLEQASSADSTEVDVTLPVDDPGKSDPPADSDPADDPGTPDDPPVQGDDVSDADEYPEAITVSSTALDTEYKINVPYAALYDMTDDRLIMTSSYVGTRIYPASTTKVLTALYSMTVFELDDEITVGDEIKMIASDSSTADIKLGDTYTFEQLLYAMMLASGNDAAYTVAVNGGRAAAENAGLSNADALAAFMAGLNRYARSIGMLDTHFVTPDGYHDDNHYTTIYDLLVMSKAALSNEALVKISSTVKYTFTNVSGTSATYSNTNGLLNEKASYYMKEAIGLKTGTTSVAGNCLIAAAKRSDGHVFIALVYGAGSGTANRFSAANKLLKYGMSYGA